MHARGAVHELLSVGEDAALSDDLRGGGLIQRPCGGVLGPFVAFRAGVCRLAEQRVVLGGGWGGAARKWWGDVHGSCL